nr:PREDICTED: collectin-12-like [Paralichthys olivaceus]
MLLFFEKKDTDSLKEIHFLLVQQSKNQYQDLKALIENIELSRKNNQERPIQNCIEEYARLEAEFRILQANHTQSSLKPDHNSTTGTTGTPGTTGTTGTPGTTGTTGTPGTTGTTVHHLRCRPGWEQHASRCFHMPQYTKNWENAREDCIDQGGDLAAVLDVEDQKFLTNLTFQFVQEYLQNDFHSAWIGLHDQVQEGTFVWVNSSRPNTEVTYWKDGEPNNAIAPWDAQQRGQDCVAIIPPKNIGAGDWLLNWDDIICVGKRHFVCETAVDRPP